MKRKPLTCTASVIIDVSIVPWDSLTDEQKEEIKDKMSKRLSKVMSEYYSNHPEEYAKL